MLDLVRDMCDSFASKRSKSFAEDISRALTCGNIFKSFQECYNVQDHTSTVKAFTTVNEQLTDVTCLYTISIMLMNMYLPDNILKEMYDLIVKRKMERFLNGIVHFGVILFQVSMEKAIVSKNAYFSCISGKTYFVNNIIKQKSNFRKEVLPTLRVLLNMVWFCFINHEILTNAKIYCEVSYIMKSHLNMILLIITHALYFRSTKKKFKPLWNNVSIIILIPLRH